MMMIADDDDDDDHDVRFLSSLNVSIVCVYVSLRENMGFKM